MELLSITLFQIGENEITLLSLISIAITLVIAYLVSRYLRKFLRKKVFHSEMFDKGAQHSILTIIHYLIMLIGVYAALNIVGIQLTALLAAAGVLGIALGFGLKTIISNFVSGLIIIGERNMQVGDRITVEDQWGEVTEITMRSTTVTTNDNVEVVVPNEDFITKKVINWTRQDSRVRIHVPIGVAYGSDVEEVRKILKEIAEDHESVLDNPDPRVFFKAFGDSSLNFDLACWIPDPGKKLPIKSDLNYEIERRFREENIEIPFPQRDIHMMGEE